jgi:transcriptional regulator
MQPDQKRDFLDFDLGELLSKDEKKLLDTFLKSLLQNKDIKNKKIKITIEHDNYITISIFSDKLCIFESIVKYLHENKNLSYKEISNITKRSTNNINVTYLKAYEKYPRRYTKLDFSTSIPYTIFSKKYTCFESITLYLKKSGLKYSEIATLLKRDDRTVWTVYQRALKKGDKK